MKDLFRVFYLREMKKHLGIILFIIAGYTIAISLLATTIIINENAASYIKQYGKLINHGNLSVMLNLENYAGNDAYVPFPEFEMYLKDQGEIKYTTEQYLRPSDGAVCKSALSQTTLYPYYRFMDFSEIKRFADVENKVEKNCIVISKTIASRLSVEKGDKVSLSFHETGTIQEFEVSEIVSENEINLGMAVDYGYILFDNSQLPGLLEGVVPEGTDINNILFKAFYINGNEKAIKAVSQKAEALFESADIPIRMATAQDIKKQVDALTGSLNMVLCFFTIMSFILATFGLGNLFYIRLINRRKELAILKVYGLNGKRSFLLSLIELYLYALPAILIGILIGYETFLYIGRESGSVFGTNSMDFQAMAIAIGKILFTALSSIVMFVYPVMRLVNSSRPADILERDKLPFLTKKQLFFFGMMNGLYLMLLFWVMFQSINVVMVFGGIIVTAITLYCFSLLLKKLAAYIIRTGTYLKIGRNFVKRNTMRVPLSIVTLSLCLSFIFVVITINYTLNRQVSNTIQKEYQYNVEVTTEFNKRTQLESFVKETGLDSYYTMNRVNGYIIGEVEEERTFPAKLQIYNFDNFKNNSFPLDLKGVSITNRLANLRGLEIGSQIIVDIDGSQLPFKVARIEDTSFYDTFTIGVHKDLIKKMTGHDGLSSQLIYYFNLSKEQKESIKTFSRKHSGIFVMDTEKIASDTFSVFGNYELIFNLLTGYFLLCTFIVIITCNIITYENRLREFCVYEVYGATKKVLKKLIVFEGILTAIIGGILGFLLSSVFWGLISNLIGVNMSMDLVFSLLTGLFGVFIYVIASFAVIKMLRFESMANLLRDEE